MSLIQILLILTAVAFLIVYLGFFRSVLRDRLIAVIIFASAVFAILFPDLTTKVANFVGVGRGTDLILYLLVVGSMFAVVMLTSRLMNVEKALTEVVRQFAITNAERPQSND
jgi:hypothetical protein